MIKIENVKTFGWEAAIRGMRNPLNSWEKSDTGYRDDESDKFYRSLNEELGIDKCRVRLGPNDEKLMKTLIRGGPVECKFRRMIHVQMDITAPLYWWKEFDTYKVGTVANSCSTMHKIHAKEFTMEDFSTEHLSFIDIGQGVGAPRQCLQNTITMLNECRKLFIRTKYKQYWWQMIQLLPSSYNQKRTVDISYEVLANIYRHRKGHKLDEWRELCFNMSEILPYSWIFTEEFEGGAGWKDKDPDYKDILLKISALVKEGKIKQEDILEAVGFSFGVDLKQNGDSQTIMNLKSQELESNAQQATDLKGEKERPYPFCREGEQQMLEEIRKEVGEK